MRRWTVEVHAVVHMNVQVTAADAKLAKAFARKEIGEKENLTANVSHFLQRGYHCAEVGEVNVFDAIDDGPVEIKPVFEPPTLEDYLSDLDTLKELALRGWSREDANALVACLEHNAPDLDEDVACARISRLKAKYGEL